MPVVRGQPIVAPCLWASRARISSMVMTRPAGTALIMASTSAGAGMTTVPLPQRLLILPVIFTTRGRSLASASFSRQVFRLAMFAPHSYQFPKPSSRCGFRKGTRQASKATGDDRNGEIGRTYSREVFRNAHLHWPPRKDHQIEDQAHEHPGSSHRKPSP